MKKPKIASNDAAESAIGLDKIQCSQCEGMGYLYDKSNHYAPPMCQKCWGVGSNELKISNEDASRIVELAKEIEKVLNFMNCSNNNTQEILSIMRGEK